MKKNDYLALVAIEECAEIQQAISKGMRFGFSDTHPDRSNATNAQEVLTEFYQLTAMIEELQKQGVIHELASSEIVAIKEDKLKKVYHYMTYSQEIGTLEY